MSKSAYKQGILNVVRGTLFSLLFSVIGVLILTIVAKYTEIADKPIMIINQVIKILALLFGIFVGFRGEKGGFFVGQFVGLLYTILSFLIFSLLSGGLNFSDITLYDFLLGLACGVISGILTVNIKGLKRRKRA